MANEAVIQVRIESPLPFTVADGTGIEKGALLALTSPRTAATAAGTAEKIAGFAAREKVASDGRTELGVYRRGWFLCYCSGTINIGDPIVAAATGTYPNYVSAAGVTASGATIIGHALEAATNGQQKLMEINIGAGAGAVS